MAFNWKMMVPGLINAAGQNVGSQAGRESARRAGGAFNVMDQQRRQKPTQRKGGIDVAPSGPINPGFKLPPQALAGMAGSMMGGMFGGNRNTGVTGGMPRPGAFGSMGGGAPGGLSGLWNTYNNMNPPAFGQGPAPGIPAGPQGGFNPGGMAGRRMFY